MPKFLLPTLLMLVSFNAAAHSHPGIDSLTHSLEHLLLSYQQWLPYPAGAGLVLLLIIGLVFKRRVSSHTYRSGL